jgi:hypothetical protein
VLALSSIEHRVQKRSETADTALPCQTLDRDKPFTPGTR